MARNDIGQRILGLYAEATEGVGLLRLRDLCEAKRDGRVVVLPVKLGDTVYRVTQCETGPAVEEIEVCCISCTWDKWQHFHPYAIGMAVSKLVAVTFDLSEVGKTVFITREEALAALSRRD